MIQTSGQHIAFNSLFNRYYAVLCVYSESFVGDRQEAEDLVQSVFVNIWVKREELTFDETLVPYLYRSVHNASMQFLRHRKVQGQYSAQVHAKLTEAECIPVEWVAIENDPAEESEIQALYRQGLEQLPELTRKIFLYSREKGMKYSEIAKLTDLSVKSVEYHISKALAVFREILKDYL